MSTPSSLLRIGGRSLLLAGVVSVPVGIFTATFTPATDPALWGYPFDPGTHVAVAGVLVFAHLLKAPGFVALSRLPGGGKLVRICMLLAALGFVVLSICEGISGALVGTPLTSPDAVALNDGYGAGSMLTAVPSVIAGVVIIRRRLLPGAARWSVLLSGAFMIFVVTPALILGRGPAAYLTLTVWSVFFIWIGWGLTKAAKA